jgi:hypothetical protein
MTQLTLQEGDGFPGLRTEEDAGHARREPLRRLLTPGICCILAASLSWYGTTLIPQLKLQGEPGPVMLPAGLTASLFILGALMLIVALITGNNGPNDDIDVITREGIARALIAAVILIGYVAAWQHIHFLVSSFLCVGALIFVFGERKAFRGAVFTAAIAVLLWALFNLALKVPL